MESVGKFVQMLDLGSKKRVKAETSTQTDLRLIKHTQPDQIALHNPRDSEVLSQCYHPFSGLLGFVDYTGTQSTVLSEKAVFSLCEGFMNTKYRKEHDSLNLPPANVQL